MVSVDSLSKSYASTRALVSVSLEVRPGTLHGLLGPNGSGKSTVVKLLSGVERPDGGTITVDGVALTGLSSPARATELGISVVHQHAPLIGTSSIAENVALHHGYDASRGFVSERRLRAQAARMLEGVELDVPASTEVASLDAGTRALVAVAIALGEVRGGAKLLIVDEVTASMTSKPAGRFMKAVRRLVDGGLAVLMVTHRLPEVLEHADEVTVLTHGSVSTSLDRDEITAAAVVNALGVHHETATDDPHRGPDQASSIRQQSPMLELKGVSGSRLTGLSLSCWPGEITGLVGASSSGIDELAAILGGSRPLRSGTIILDGKSLPLNRSPRQALHERIAVVPADRLAEGGIASLTVRDNMLLPAQMSYWSEKRARRVVERMINDFDVHPRDVHQLLGALSGGNQQKVGLAKWLLLEPKLLVLDDPTNGVDVASRARLRDALRTATTTGLAVLLMSTEPETVIDFCERIHILNPDGTTDELTEDDDPASRVTMAMMG